MSRKKKTQTIGYWYQMGLHMGLCHGPVDEVSEITIDDKVAWTGSMTASGNTSIVAPILFGGQEKEGGVLGTLTVAMGEPTQPKNSYLVSKLGSLIPAFRGICAFIFYGYISANTTYIKPWTTKLKRIKKGWQNDTVWYEEKAEIGINMNPAHIIYQCLTDAEWGMSHPTSGIDDTNFRLAADKLHTEGFGLSLMWNQQSTIQQFIQIICDHINGALKVDPITGKFQLKLIRADYDPDDLPVFNQTNISQLQSFQRAGWSEIVNEITLIYTNETTRQEASITVHDLSNIQAQGQVVNQKVTFTGIASDALAQKVAMRELLSRSTPLSKLKFTVNRTAWNLLQGDVFKFAWPKLGITTVIMRVVNVSTGTLENSLITVDAVEDVFGLPNGSYASNQGNEWTPPNTETGASTLRKFIEATYYDIATTMTTADLDATDANEGYAVMFSHYDNPLALDYKLKTRIGSSGDFVQVDSGPHCFVANLTSGLAKEEYSIFDIDDIFGDIATFEIGNYLIINGEYMRVDVIDVVDNQIHVARGVVDTVPQLHFANSPVFFAEGFGSVDGTAYLDGEEIEAKVITETPTSALDESDAPIDSLTIAARQNRPYPPAKIRINGGYNPGLVSGEITITWAHRNRLQQTVSLLAQDDDSVTPEAGTTYTIIIFNLSLTMSRSVTGLTGTSYTYPIHEEMADFGGYQSHLIAYIYSKRDGLNSWQSHNFTFERIYIAKDKDLATPPSSPATGDTYIIAASPTGAWSGHAKHIAIWDGSAWDFYIPINGWRFYVADESVFYSFNGTAWVIL